MATIGDLKRHVRDHLSDAVGGKADRIALDLVNDALRELHRAHRWSRYTKRSAEIALDQAVAGAAATLTQTSDLVTLTGETVLAKYLADNEGWDLWLEGDDLTLYQATELLDPTRFRLDRAWIATTDAAAAYAWRRSRYPLPEGFRQVVGIQLSSSRLIAHLAPERFDRERFDRPTEIGAPQFFTVREGKLEVWPPLGPTTTRERVLLTYEGTPIAAKATDHADTPVDWSALDDDVLRAAINVKIATRWEKHTPLSLSSSMLEYRMALSTARARDSQRVRDTRGFTLRTAVSADVLERHRMRDMPQGADD